jgi:DDE domain
VTDRAWTLRAVVDDLIPGAFHNTEQYANNRIESDHGRLKARLRPMRGLKRNHSARVIVRGHAFMENIRRGHYELGIDARHHTGASRTRSPNSHEPSDGKIKRGTPRASRSSSTQQSREGTHESWTACVGDQPCPSGSAMASSRRETSTCFQDLRMSM